MAVDRARVAGDHRAKKKTEADGFFRVGMGDLLDLRPHGYFNPKLFAKFANQAMFERFACFDFPSREFPQPSQMVIGTTLCDKKLGLVKNESRRNVDDSAHRAIYRPMLL